MTKVGAIYRWVDGEVAQLNSSCRACGECCDFDAFGHRLYVTTPELLFFKQAVGPHVQTMAGDVCPYRVDGKCTVYPYRFAGCRIFTCAGDSEAENRLSEQAIGKFKQLCYNYKIPYRYVDLKAGLALLNGELFTSG